MLLKVSGNKINFAFINSSLNLKIVLVCETFKDKKRFSESWATRKKLLSLTV